MDDIWIISWFNHTAFDANPIWKSPNSYFLKASIFWVAGGRRLAVAGGAANWGRHGGVSKRSGFLTNGAIVNFKI